MTLSITATYAAVLALIFVAMSSYVIATRAKTETLLGAGADPRMLVTIRRHGNMAEYMPFALLMLALAEVSGVGSTWLHASGALLILGRLLHPFGIKSENSPLAPRISGMLATFAAILIPAFAVLSTRVA